MFSSCNEFSCLNLIKVISSENFPWNSYLKRMLKYREEIELDAADYARTKCLNKLLTSDDKNDVLLKIITHFLTLKLSKNVTQTHRDLILFSYLDNTNSKLVLNQFKYCLLDLVKNVRDEIKSKLLEPIFTFLIENLNDVDIMLEKTRHESVNKMLIETIINNYVVTSESAQFFVKNEKYFDYLIGYLNNTNQTQATVVIRYMKQVFVDKLAVSNQKLNFFQQLSPKMQSTLVKCCFDLLASSDINER